MAQERQEPLYEERFGPSSFTKLLWAAVPIVMLFAYFREGGGEVLPAVLFGLGALVIITVSMWLIPGSPDFSHIAVEDEGLQVGRSFLPVGDIGYAEVVAGDDATSAMWLGRYRGVRIGSRGSSFGRTDRARAVAIYTEHGGRPRVRIVKTRDPDAFVDALDRIRVARSSPFG